MSEVEELLREITEDDLNAILIYIFKLGYC